MTKRVGKVIEAKLPKLLVGTKITVTMPIGVINEVGRNDIGRFLDDLYLAPLPEWWDYNTQVKGRGEYVGSFCKRVAKYFYQTETFKISSDNLGKLGHIMSKHTDKNSQYIIDYTQKFDWDAGDFGDGGSCFWSCHKSARYALENEGAYAIRFYHDTFSRYGYARAWIYPTNDFYIVFNGYGLETTDTARIMAHQLKMSYRKIELSNHGEKEGFLWINGSKENGDSYGNGFIIGPESVVHGRTHYDLSIEDETVMCHNCEDRIDQDDAQINNGDYFCQSCFDDAFSQCENCKDYYCSDDMCSVHSCRYVCHECFNSYVYCEECEEYHHEDNITEITDICVCDDCLDRWYSQCTICNEWTKSITDVNNDEEQYCDECLVDCTCCYTCGEFFTNDHFKNNKPDTENPICMTCKMDNDKRGGQKFLTFRTPNTNTV